MWRGSIYANCGGAKQGIWEEANIDILATKHATDKVQLGLPIMAITSFVRLCSSIINGVYNSLVATPFWCYFGRVASVCILYSVQSTVPARWTGTDAPSLAAHSHVIFAPNDQCDGAHIIPMRCLSGTLTDAVPEFLLCDLMEEIVELLEIQMLPTPQNLFPQPGILCRQRPNSTRSIR